MDRRELLKRGLLGGVLLAGAGLVAWPPDRTYAPQKTQFLSSRGAAVLGAIAARVVQAPGVDPRAIVERIDASLEGLPPEMARDLDRLLVLFDSAIPGLLLDGHLRPFSRLAADAQDAVLRAWRDSNITLRRAGYQVVRRLCLIAYYGDRSTHLALGYPGPRPTGGFHYDDSKMGT